MIEYMKLKMRKGKRLTCLCEYLVQLVINITLRE